jgi:hypothetical protein
MINPLSFSSTKLDLFSKEGLRLKSASGFVVEADKQYYLVTNRHVLSGRDISAREPQEPEVQPFLVKTALQTYGGTGDKGDLFSRGVWNRITIQLYDENNTPIWIEGRANERHQPLVDVVALPIQWAQTFVSEVSKDVEMSKRLRNQALRELGPWVLTLNEPPLWGKICAIPVSAIDTDVAYGPPDTVYIIGYPHGWAPAGGDKSSAAFWRTSSIASELNTPGMIQSNGFFIDPPAPEGMSGSPVVGTKNDRLKLLGVYSDASTAEFGANAGLVWDACLVKELIRGS